VRDFLCPPFVETSRSLLLYPRDRPVASGLVGMSPRNLAAPWGRWEVCSDLDRLSSPDRERGVADGSGPEHQATSAVPRPTANTHYGSCYLAVGVPDSLLLKTGKFVVGLLESVLLGFISGGICGAAILSFNVFIGRSQTTGMHFGDWNPAVLWVGSVYRRMFGMFAPRVAYVLLSRKIGFQRAFVP
jgi:hypothetical protein